LETKNIKINITDENIDIVHHDEILISWSLNEWTENNSFATSVKIARAIQLASNGEIMKLRVLLGKFLCVGSTNIGNVKDGVLNYFISSINNGLKIQVGWTDSLDEILETWNNMIQDPSNHKLSLCKVIVVERELGLDIVDVEVIKEHIK